MKIECGGSLILSGPNDIYGIQKDEFEHTYAGTGKDKSESLKEAIALMGISKEEFMVARQKAQQEPSSNSDKVVSNDGQELE